jgi:uncharacterized UBP type Zn finger protein
MSDIKTTGGWQHRLKENCPHMSGVDINITSDKTQCERCDVTTDLRQCLTCGFVACCESSNAHNTEHYQQTQHAIIRPYACNYEWLWCYSCNAFLDEKENA